MENTQNFESVFDIEHSVQVLRERIVKFCKQNADKVIRFGYHFDDTKFPSCRCMYCYYDEGMDDVVIKTDSNKFHTILFAASVDDVISISKAILNKSFSPKPIKSGEKEII